MSARRCESGASLACGGQAIPRARQLDHLLTEIRACTLCAAHFPHAPRPMLRAAPGARILIVGQAPGRRVHETGIPWNDASGELLRDWLRIDRALFYDQTRIAIVPAGLCYPGKGAHGDRPPRAECAPMWQPRVRAQLRRLRLTLLIGAYAQAYYLGSRRRATLSATVRDWQQYLPQFFPLPHPSPRNRGWIKSNSWFADEVLPALREHVHRVLAQ